MPRLRITCLTALAVLALCAPPSALAAIDIHATSHAGACNGAEGVTVVVDTGSANGLLVRCAVGTPTSGLDALTRAYEATTISTAFGPQVCTVERVGSSDCSASLDTWVYWQRDAATSAWAVASSGADSSTPKPGDVEGWHWIPDYNAWPGDEPRLSPKLATLGEASATPTGPHAATIAVKVTAGGGAQQVRVEYVQGDDDSAAARTAGRTVAAGTTADVTFPLTGLAANATFRWRVSTTGDAGTVTGAWSTFATPRTAARLVVRPAATFLHRGTRAVVRVERLDAGEVVTLRLGSATVGTATANADGDARIVATVPKLARTGAAKLVAEGSTTDRTGSAAATVTRSATLKVAAVPLRGLRVRVTVTGLAAFEPVTVRQGRSVLARGTATRTGRFVRVVTSTKRWRYQPVVATGSHATRTGDAPLPVPARHRAARR